MARKIELPIKVVIAVSVMNLKTFGYFTLTFFKVCFMTELISKRKSIEIIQTEMLWVVYFCWIMDFRFETEKWIYFLEFFTFFSLLIQFRSIR